MTIKYNTDPAGNIKVITKDGKVSCECCNNCTGELFGGIEISKEIFEKLLSGFSVSSSASSIFTNKPFICNDNTGFSFTSSLSKDEVQIYCSVNNPLGANGIGFFTISEYEKKYYIAFVSGSIGGQGSIYLAFLRPGFSDAGIVGVVPNSYITSFSGSFTINGEGMPGVWYQQAGCCGVNDGATVAATISISITTNDP